MDSAARRAVASPPAAGETAPALPAADQLPSRAAPPPPPPPPRALTRLADALRELRFRAWVVTTQLRLIRLGVRLHVHADGTPRFDRVPRVLIGATGGSGGSLTLRMGTNCRFGADVTFDLDPATHGVVELGSRVTFQDRIRLQPWGGAIRIGDGVQVRDGAELKSRGELVLSRGVLVGRNVTVHCHERIDLLDNAGLAEGVKVMDSDHTHDGSDRDFLHQPTVSTPVLIGANVMVATNAVVMRGAHLGRNSMVATGAVVTAGDHPEGHLLAGTPAQAVRRLEPTEV